MDDVEFTLKNIEQTLATYKKNLMYEGIVVSKRDNGAVFNIGGKTDAFIEKSEFNDYGCVKIGDRFKVTVLGGKTEDGMILVSKKHAENILIDSQTAESLKVGSEITFFVTALKNDKLLSRLGEYNIIVPEDEADAKSKPLAHMLNKQHKGVVTEINKEQKQIIVSVKLLHQQAAQRCENVFWNCVFINKLVIGKVVKLMPYGAFVDVDGANCFIHISDISYNRIESPAEVLTEGQSYTFRIIKLDKDAKRVSLGLKQLEENPKTKALKLLNVGEVHAGSVTKILPFGAIIKLENQLDGLLHISNASDDTNKRIYEIVKLGDKVNVEIINIDIAKNKLGFKLAK